MYDDECAFLADIWELANEDVIEAIRYRQRLKEEEQMYKDQDVGKER